jgi:opacity protein-like surface antigen
MKKSLFAVFIFALLFVSHTSNAQVYEKGNVVVDAFYGFPNLYTAYVRGVYNNNVANGTNTYTDVKIKSLGPLGITGEYLLSSKVGIGFEATYASTSVTANYYEYQDGNTYAYTASINRMRILPRVNIHFGDNDKVDPYLALGMGYANLKASYETANPYQSQVTYRSVIPVSYRMGFGVRYFFTDHVGAMVEFGFGGALLRGGLSVKF